MMWKWWKKNKNNSEYIEEKQENYYEEISKNADLYKVNLNSFSEAGYIAKMLQKKRAIFINLKEVPLEEKRRILDFLSGTIYLVQGKVKKVKDNIYYFQLPEEKS